MRICLIQPGFSKRDLDYQEGSALKSAKSLFNRFSRIKLGGGRKLPPMSLMQLAALTPQNHELFIVDEEVQVIDFDMKVDLAGITMLTRNAHRGYEIADRFRERGIKVVLGGMHATAIPEEAIRHADAVVIGEAEEVWLQVLEDSDAGRLRRFYRGKNLCQMRNMPLPCQDLLNKQKYLSTNLIQTSRGCPNRCSFCSIHLISGREYRFRPVSEVISEIETFTYPLALFVDDNIVGNKEHARELFKALISLKISWTAQATLSIAYDDDLLRLASRSGCRYLLVGFESLSDKNIMAIGKARTNKVSEYAERVKKIHDYGIGIAGTFILGLDDDDSSAFDRTADFIEKNRIDTPTVGVLTPYPGSPLFKKLESEGRLLHRDWPQYSHTIGKVVFRPRLMTAEQLEEGHRLVGRRLFSMQSITKRLSGVRGHLLYNIAWNLGKRQAFY
jgi:radical SAM superfamily enzyme YgiQ (UPF0313 family)